MKLSKRLKTISNYIDDNSNVIDVGCDHALLSIYLVKNKKNIKVVASDINEGPLEKAKENIKKYDVEDKIKLILANGIDKMPKYVNTIVIAGMGYLTIKKILQDNIKKLENINKIVISINDDFYDMRKFITSLNFYIGKEEIIEDHNKFYLILSLVNGNKKYSNNELKYGIKESRNNIDYKKYIKYQIKQKQNILKQLPNKKIITKLKLKGDLKKLSKLGSLSNSVGRP